MSDVTSNFSLPRSTFPPGPYTRDELSHYTIPELGDLEVTRENVHQIAFFGARINAESIRSIRSSIYDVEPDFFEDETLLQAYFRGWASSDIKDIVPVLEQYKIVIYDARAWIYLPEIYFVDEEGLVIRTGPFILRPAGEEGTPMARVLTPDPSGTLFEYSSKWAQGNHPHISTSGAVCLGTESSTYYASMRAGDNLGCCMAMESILPYYNPDDPYHVMSSTMPSEVQVPLIPTEPSLRISARNGSSVRGCPIAEKESFTIGSLTLNLTQREIQDIKEEPELFSSFFSDLARGYLSSSLSYQQRQFMNRALPRPSADRPERLIAAGVSVTQAFNPDDEPLEAAVLPPDRRLTLDLPDHIKELANSSDDLSDTEEADDSESSQDQSQEERSSPQATVSHTESPF